MNKVSIGELKPYELNAKKHPKKQIQQVANSIKAFGFNQPIVVDKDNVVIVGHGRLEAAKLLGLKEVPVLKVDLREDQAKAYRLADNKLNESEWDMKLVIDELKELDAELIDLTGFDTDLIVEPEEKDDEVPDVPEEPTSKLGEIYQLGEHRLMCGSATELDDVETLMDGQKADMVFTDPPYGMNFDIKNDDGDKYKQLFTDALVGMYQFTKKENWYICGNFRCLAFFQNEVEKLGMELYEKIVWVKNLYGQGKL